MVTAKSSWRVILFWWCITSSPSSSKKPNDEISSLSVSMLSSSSSSSDGTVISRHYNDDMALPNINNGNPLRHNDDLCRHQIVILLEVVNDAAPCPTSYLVVTIKSDSCFCLKLRSWGLKSPQEVFGNQAELKSIRQGQIFKDFAQNLTRQGLSHGHFWIETVVSNICPLI